MRSLIIKFFVFLLCVIGIISSVSCEAKRKTVEEYQDELDEKNASDNAAFAEALPAIVCWGDSLTFGSGGEGTSFPYVLGAQIKHNICKKYDVFHSYSEKDAEYLKGIISKTYYLNAPEVVNMGVPGEDTSTIAAREGAFDVFLAEDLTIPANTSDIPITLSQFSCSSGRTVSFRDDSLEASIGGIDGYIKFVWEEFKPYFARKEAGEEITLTAGTAVKLGCAELYDDYIRVIFTGTNLGYDTPEELVAHQKVMIEKDGQNKDKYLVIGLYYNWNVETGDDLIPYIEAQKEAFGDRYFDLREYLLTDALSDAGIEPTEYDENRISLGLCPPSLLVQNDNCHFTAQGYTVVGKKLYKVLDGLGYFNAAKAAVGISD